MVKGNIDNSRHVTTNVTHQYGPQAPTATELFEQGKAALARKDYRRARDCFSAALDTGQVSADMYYCHALALLDGKRPKLHNRSHIQIVERQLEQATAVDSNCGHAWLLWAIVRFDYYTLNRIYVRGLTVEQMLINVKSLETQFISELQAHIHAPDNRVMSLLR